MLFVCVCVCVWCVVVDDYWVCILLCVLAMVN